MYLHLGPKMYRMKGLHIPRQDALFVLGVGGGYA